MQQYPVCSRCGSLLVNGCCSGCGNQGATQVATAPSKASTPRSKLIARIVAIVGGGSLAYALVVWHLIGFVVREAHARSSQRTAVSMRNWPRHLGPVAPVSELQGHGTVYLVQMGEHKSPYAIGDLARSLGSQYRLDIRVLPASGLDSPAWDAGRHQYIAESLLTQLEREHADLVADPDAYLIGFTDADMYSVTHNWESTFTERGMPRTAVISSFEMGDADRWRVGTVDGHSAIDHFQARMRRIFLKDIAILYWHLPSNNDPTSLLYVTLNPDKPTDDVYESDLHPEQSPWGEDVWQPCQFLTYSAKAGLRPVPGEPIRSCSDVRLLPAGEDNEIFEVQLRWGLIAVRHTDFDLPGTMPIRFERVWRPGWPGPDSFGASGTDNYNSHLSSNDNIQINLNENDASSYSLIRSPRWLPLLGFVKYVDQGMSGRYYAMRWKDTPLGHYELQRYDGQVSTYLPCGNSLVLKCYLDGVREPDGRGLVFVRDGERRLDQLNSSDHDWLHITHGPGAAITAITASNGRTVKYGYNDKGQLVSASYPTGEVLHYTYDDAENLLTFSVAADAESEPRVLLRNEYDHGVLVRMTVAGERTYTYNYDPTDSVPARGVMLRSPEGSLFRIWMSGQDAHVWEQPSQAPAASGAH